MDYEAALRPERSGVYALPRPIRPLREAAARARLVWFELDAVHARDKSSFLAACAQQLGFPPHFGHNWDALADCLRDFSWKPAPGYVIVWRGVRGLERAEPDALATALEVLREAALFWSGRGKAFFVLLDREPPGAALPALY
jgi:RNAse (barnase) inhibitor barstar